MKYLTLDHIRQQLRIDQTGEEDAVLDLYGSAAEETVLNICNRTIDDVIETYGGVPDPVRQATLLLVDHSYTQRSPASVQNISIVPDSFDMLIKPYIRLTSGNTATCGDRLQTVILGSGVKIDLTAAVITGGESFADIDFSVVVYNVTAIDKKKAIKKDECIISDDGTVCSLLVDTEDLGVGQLMVRVIMSLPDESWPSGYRKEVRKHNPYIMVIG